ncbi:glutaconyl-CoA decarboxylase subunit alpha [Caproiciproducens sp. NJN-50]|uniref:acyl-CoA carboxylase subunit beta n=1 Tax=Caproiciproducens sp. NJN-50 TaxID=2507162 RepID=UPI000FFE0E0E|nr:carboxyl transferase domain-containing protein [Caproiciproducens sp. NJN-50]QAT50472.1 glutaconyl-CoA decarboxylase subunit alpha [Caproiciproducens sp. NJN-50]
MSSHEYSMPGYFQNMPVIGKPLRGANEENEAALKKAEAEIGRLATEAEAAGRSDESLRASGQMTARDRIAALVDEGTWRPLNSLYNPAGNEDRSTAILKGLGRIHGKWAVVVASDNKKLAGAWVPGQSENLLRASDTAKCLHIPLVYILNCSGVKLDEQEKVYANRRGGGTPFYRNAELQQLGVPVLVGIYGTNPAGGGYHSISPTILIAHAKANMAVGGAGILGGMNPKGYMDLEGAEQLIKAQSQAKTDPPGSIAVHYSQTGFFREVYTEELGVLEAIKKYMDDIPAYNLDFFRVDDPREPRYDANELYDIVPMNQKKQYNIYDVLGRVFDGSEFSEFKPGYGPEIVAGLAKIDGLLTGVVANVQGLLMQYPEYKRNSVGIGGKLYRQGLIKMNEFVTLCGRDRIPIIWFQDTTGIDVGDDAERAELLGLGQSLIYSIESSGIPQMEITLRKGTAAAHYVMGGPQGNSTNAFSLGTAATEMYVMNGETAAAAMYSRRLVKDQKAGKDLQPTIDKMNEMIGEYDEKSRPKFCAQAGFVDEIVPLPQIRRYAMAFVDSVYQNPESICAFHQMLLPRVIRDFNTYKQG